METMKYLLHRVVIKIKSVNTFKELTTVPDTQKMLIEHCSCWSSTATATLKPHNFKKEIMGILTSL